MQCTMNFFVLKNGHLQIIIIALKIAAFGGTKNVHSAFWNLDFVNRNKAESVLLKLFQLWLKFSVAKFMYKLKFILITLIC